MHTKNTIDTGNGWILPDNKCLEISTFKDTIQTLRDYDPNINSLFLSKDPKDPHSIGEFLEELYRSNYVRVGIYRDTVLFEHGVNSKPTKEQMAGITSNIKYNGSPVTYRSKLYNSSDNIRKRFFCDKY